MLNLLDRLKQNQEDFEFYPTTDKMLDIIFNDIYIGREKISLLDIGAGTCKIFNRYQDKICNYYIIEKSSILLEKAPAEAIVVGTDFNKCSLIDKNVNIIFCNPPYSEFEEWTAKILEENYSQCVYMIIPSRWKDSQRIQDIIKDRKIVYDILETTDFLNAERQARAKVDIIKFRMKSLDFHNSDIVDPFEYWFNKNFKFNISKEKIFSFEERAKEEKRLNELIKQKGVVETLVENYNIKMQNLLNNYKQLASLDSDLLKTLNCNVKDLMAALKEKIKGLKNLHWQSLVDNLGTITERLTNKSRDNILETINRNFSVDFDYDNIYAVVMWIIKQANKYYDKQLVEVFRELSERCNCIKYKSNKQTWEKDGWRWNRQEANNYLLDYRIILQYCSYRWQYIICDLITIANNLGFNIRQFQRFHESTYKDDITQHFGEVRDANGNVFIDYKKYKNGNIHLKINQEFMKALNIEVGRLLGWLRNKQEAQDETGFDIDVINKYFGSVKGIPLAETKRLLLINETKG